MCSRPTHCTHPSVTTLDVGTIARWCQVCGALKLDEGPLAAQWLRPKTAALPIIIDHLRGVLAVLESAIEEAPGLAR